MEHRKKIDAALTRISRHAQTRRLMRSGMRQHFELEYLDSLCWLGGEATVEQVAAELGINENAAYHMLRRLVMRGYVRAMIGSRQSQSYTITLPGAMRVLSEVQ